MDLNGVSITHHSQDETGPAMNSSFSVEHVAAIRGDRPWVALEILRHIMDSDPENGVAFRLFNETLSVVFNESRRAFAEGRRLDCIYLMGILADHAQPAEALRADLSFSIQRLLQQALEVLKQGDVAAARREIRQALAIDPGFGESWVALAYLERSHGEPEAGLRTTLRALQLTPQTAQGEAHRDWAVLRVAEALLAALRAGDSAQATRLANMLVGHDPGFAQALAHLPRLNPDPREIERELLLWLGRHKQEKRHFDAALDYALQAAALRICPRAQRAEADARQHLALEHLRFALQAHCSAYVNDVADPAGSRDIFHALDRLMVQGLMAPNIDHWTRTQYWGALMGWRAVVNYTAALNACPYTPAIKQMPAVPAAPRGGGRRLFDCCTFFTEIEILEIRMRELYDVVDGFVVVEATHTHAGQPKALVLHDQCKRLRPYLDKMIYLVDNAAIDGFSWQREAQQRDAIIRGLTGCGDEDLVIVSDVDEIVRHDVAARLRQLDPAYQGVVTLELDLFFYRLNYRFRRDWRSAAVAPYGIVRQVGANAIRYLSLQEMGPVLPEAGWHFSWMGDTDRFIAKMTAYAHQEHAARYSAEAQRNIDDMRRFLTEGGPPPACGPGNGLDQYEILPMDDNAPLLVREERERFITMGWLAS